MGNKTFAERRRNPTTSIQAYTNKQNRHTKETQKLDIAKDLLG